MPLQLNREQSASPPSAPGSNRHPPWPLPLALPLVVSERPSVTEAGPRVSGHLAAGRLKHRSTIGCFADQLFSPEPRRHLINAALTGRTARDFTCWGRGEEKNPSVASKHRIKDTFRISYVIKSDLCLHEHHAAHRAAGRRVLSCSPLPKNYLLPPPPQPRCHSRFPPSPLFFFFSLTAASRSGHLYNNCHPPLFNSDMDEALFNMADLSPIMQCAVARRPPAW